MSIKTRLAVLEALTPGITEPIKISWFSVWPGRIDDEIGYTADTGEVIMRNPGESSADLQKRCGESVVWVPGEWRQFSPIFTEGNHEH